MSSTSPRFGAAVLLTLACLGVPGCTAAPVVRTLYPEGADFSAYRTFAFEEEDLLVVSSPSPVNPALQPILVEEVQAYLTKRGYAYAPDAKDADFTIGFALGGAPTATTTVFGDNYNQVRIIGDGVDEEIVTQESTQAGLVIDFYDPSGRKRWTGWAVQEITMGDQIRLRSTVRDTIAIILKKFPPES